MVKFIFQQHLQKKTQETVDGDARMLMTKVKVLKKGE